jgi:hypothetical protein
MPLEKGRSRAVFSHNVAEMVKAGHPQKQAVAAAYRERGETRDDAPGSAVNHRGSCAAVHPNQTHAAWRQAYTARTGSKDTATMPRLTAADAVAKLAAPLIARRRVADRAAGLAALRVAARRGVPARDALTYMENPGSIGDVPLVAERKLPGTEVAGKNGGETSTHDDWSPEARKAAAEARKAGVSKEHHATATEHGFQMRNKTASGAAYGNGKSTLHVGKDDSWKHTNASGAVLGAGRNAESMHQHLFSHDSRRTGDEHEGFKKLDRSLAHRKGVHNAAALSAWIGRKKMGKKAFQAKAAAGRK